MAASRDGQPLIGSDPVSARGFVAVRERVNWRDADEVKHAQIALAVYEVEGAKIRRVWYYPAQPD